MDGIKFRNYVPGDHAYIMANMLRELRDADPNAVPSDLWFPMYRELIEKRLLVDPAIDCIIACAEDKPSEIEGFILAEKGQLLWFVFVRKGLRQSGIARELMRQLNLSRETPAALTTPDLRRFLKNPCRGKQVRSAMLTGRK